MGDAPGEAGGLFVVVDATNYLFRSYHAIRDMRTRDGRPTNAIYGLATSLVSLREKYPAAAFVCVMDAPGKTFRHESYDEYKATRKKTDQELLDQIDPAKELIKALGMPLYCVPKVEADDVIATVAVARLAEGDKVLIASSDKDLMYLAGRGCGIINPRDGSVQDAAAVEKRYGVRPEYMLDYLTLVGDASDNIPGVPGVGPKTAAKWIVEYGHLDSIVSNQDRIKGKVGESFRAAVPGLDRWRGLIRLKEDVALDPALEARPPAPDAEAIDAFCKRHRFNPALQERMARRTVQSAGAERALMIEILRTAQEFAAAASYLEGTARLALHAELAGADAPSLEPVSYALYCGERGFYIPLGHRAGLADSNAEPAAARAFLAALLARDDLELCVFRSKEFIHALRNAGIGWSCRLTDVALQCYCLDSTSMGTLESISRRYLDYRVPERSSLVGGRDLPKEYAELEIDEARKPACQWACAVHDLRRAVGRQLDARSLKLYREVELPAVEPLAAMESEGIKLDTARLAELDAELKARMAELEESIAQETGKSVNLNSPAQLAELLYDHLGLDPGRKTRGGARSTNETELERLAANPSSPVPALVLEYRHAAKLSGTYTSALPQRINPRTGRLHTRFIQAGAVTGRLASADPNLQNIPVRTEHGQRIRQCFAAPAGSKLFSADYSQIELRILAHFSDDPTLLEAFAQGQDVHRRTAAELYSIDTDAVNDDQRRFAKTINFGLIYGMGAFGLAQRMGIAQKEARELIESYFARMPGVRDYLKNLKERAAEEREVSTLFGRRISVATSSRPANRGGALRAAVNAPMQGSAADIVKLAMSAVFDSLRRERLRSRLLLQVHDELVLEVPDDEAERIGRLLPEAMRSVAQLKVPLEVEVGSGASWGEAH